MNQQLHTPSLDEPASSGSLLRCVVPLVDMSEQLAWLPSLLISDDQDGFTACCWEELHSISSYGS
jgi:hypothetical protein